MDRGTYDALTGLYSREYYRNNAHDYLESILTPSAGAACLFYDIASMKAYNDHYGYDAGNDLLKEIAGALSRVYPNALIARTESDHFVVLACEDDVMAHLDESVEKIQHAGSNRPVKVRVGIFPIATPDIDPIFAADNAKLAADSLRSDPDHSYVFFDTAFAWRVSMGRHVVDSLDTALEQGWIKVYYQPVIRTLTNALCGLEALARWDDPVHGMLAPGAFIPALEDAHVIHKLDSYVVREVCKLYRERTDADKPTVPVSVNLSRLDFVACDVHEVIDKAVEEFDVPREMLNIEITESTFIQDADIIARAMKRFHESGHNVWMDDFGSGYSSLNVLKDYNFDEIKLDMAFLSSFTETSRNIVSSTVTMAKRIGIHTLAEGVETKEQFKFLRSIGCEKAQGYYFGMPLPIDEAMHLVNVHGLQIETPPWRRYFDAIGAISFDTANPLVILEDDGADFHVLYLNKAGKETLDSLGVDGLRDKDATAAFMKSSLAQRLRSNLAQPLAPEEELEFPFFGNGQQARIELRGLARNGRAHAYQLIPTGLSYAQSPENLLLASASQALSSACHDLQVLDIEADTTAPVIGIDQIADEKTAHGVAHTLRVYAYQELYPLDIARFLAFTNPKTIRARLSRSPNRNLYDCFRCITTTGDYQWRAYSILPLREGTNRLALYSRDMNYESPIQTTLVQGEQHDREVAGISEASLLAILHELYDDMDNPVSLSDIETHELLYLNPCGQRTFGTSEDEMRTIPCYRILRGEKIACTSCREQLLTGKKHEEMSSFNPKLVRYFNHKDSVVNVDGRMLRLELTFDLSREQKAMSELAETDSLTGLLNRRGCDRIMSEMLHQNPIGNFAAVALDVNDFKLFNDLYGHTAGDALLMSVSYELKELFGPTCAIGRNGGDEFLVLIPNSTGDEAEELVRRFSANQHRFTMGGTNYVYGISAGYALYPEQAHEFVELIRKADRALYHVKTNPGTWKCYEPQMEFESRTMLGFNLKDIALGMPGAILVYRADGAEEILFANDELVRMFECDNMDDFLTHVGHSFKTLVHPGDIDRVEESIWNQIANNDENLDYVDYRIITKSGKVKDIWDTGRLVESPYYGQVFYVFMYDKGKWEQVIAHQ